MEARELKDSDTFLIPNRPKICYGFFYLDYFYMDKEKKEDLLNNTQKIEVVQSASKTQQSAKKQNVVFDMNDEI